MRIEAATVPALKFLGYLVLATYGLVGLSVLLEMVLISLIGDRSYLDYFVIAPMFGLPIILSLLIGYRFGGRLPALASRLLWVVPFLLLVSQVCFDFVNYSRLQYAGE